MLTNNYNNKIFFIKKLSTLPKVKYSLDQRILEKYDITEEMLQDVAITFSMIDENGIYRIANVEAELIVNTDRPTYPDETKYTLAYQFTEKQTSKAGKYYGEFVIDFLGENSCGKIKFPVDDFLSIVIQDSITKTTVV